MGLVSVVKTTGFIFENFCFIYLGIITFNIFFKNLKFLQIFIAFCIVISLCIIRWVSVSLPYLIGKRIGQKSLDIQGVCQVWFSGLIRGSLSIALCILHNQEGTSFENIVVLVASFTTIFFGLSQNSFFEKIQNQSQRGLSLGLDFNDSQQPISKEQKLISRSQDDLV